MESYDVWPSAIGSAPLADITYVHPHGSTSLLCPLFQLSDLPLAGRGQTVFIYCSSCRHVAVCTSGLLCLCCDDIQPTSASPVTSTEWGQGKDLPREATGRLSGLEM